MKAPPPAKEIRFGATHGIYPNVSIMDGRLAIEMLLQKTIVQKAYPYIVKLSFIEPGSDIPDTIRKRGYHFMTLSSIDFFKYRGAVHLDPIMTPSKIATPTERLLLLLGKNQTLSAIRHKEERTLIVETGSSGDLSLIWLDTVLRDQGLPGSRLFFTKIRRVSKPGRAVLPVFFNQADACIITEDALDVIQELNPQITRRIAPRHRSQPFLRTVICATDKPSREEKDLFVRESIHIESNPDTQQAMTILQMKRFLRVSPEDLTATEALLTRHRHKIGNGNS